METPAAGFDGRVGRNLTAGPRRALTCNLDLIRPGGPCKTEFRTLRWEIPEGSVGSDRFPAGTQRMDRKCRGARSVPWIARRRPGGDGSAKHIIAGPRVGCRVQREKKPEALPILFQGSSV